MPTATGSPTLKKGALIRQTPTVMGSPTLKKVALIRQTPTVMGSPTRKKREVAPPCNPWTETAVLVVTLEMEETAPETTEQEAREVLIPRISLTVSAILLQEETAAAMTALAATA